MFPLISSFILTVCARRTSTVIFKMSPLIMMSNILGFMLIIVAALKPCYGLYLGRRHLYIRNDLENHLPLKIHCWSKDNDLGLKTLNFTQETSWSFKDNYIWGTKFECDMEFQLEGQVKRGQVVVYNNKKKIRTRECRKRCKWSVRKYGLYAFDEKDKKWDFEIPW